MNLSSEPSPHRESTDWRMDAACSPEEVDPEIFFPAKGDEVAHRVALSYCARCPVTTRCLAEALSDTEIKGVVPQDHGIWGGTTAMQRAKMPRRSSR